MYFYLSYSLLKDKLQSELINAESDNNNAAKTKIQCELDKTGTDLNDLTTKEANVGKVLEKCQSNSNCSPIVLCSSCQLELDAPVNGSSMGKQRCLN